MSGAAACSCADVFDHGGSRADVLRVRNGHARSIRGHTLRDAAPMPREPPVTSATLLANLDMDLLWFL
jgi:hypothetical protein